MIIWGIFWGAVLGSWFGGYGDFGPFVGGILGFFAGLSRENRGVGRYIAGWPVILNGATKLTICAERVRPR